MVILPDVTANAKVAFYTKDDAGIDNSVMINGTSMKLSNIGFTSSTGINLRYEKLDSGFKVWITKALDNDDESSKITITGLEALSTYSLDDVKVATDKSGNINFMADLTKENSLIVLK